MAQAELVQYWLFPFKKFILVSTPVTAKDPFDDFSELSILLFSFSTMADEPSENFICDQPQR